jgi:hypothetical protein
MTEILTGFSLVCELDEATVLIIETECIHCEERAEAEERDEHRSYSTKYIAKYSQTRWEQSRR